MDQALSPVNSGRTLTLTAYQNHRYLKCHTIISSYKVFSLISNRRNQTLVKKPGSLLMLYPIP